MPKPTAKWVTEMPGFLGAIACATSEDEIRKACEEIKASVVDSYPHTPPSRKNPMTEIRKQIRGRYPTTDKETKFYYFTESGVGKSPRWEHLAIKYLEAEWDRKPDRSFENPKQQTEVKSVESVEPKSVEPTKLRVVKTEIDILSYIGLDGSDLEKVKQAIGDTDVKEWVRQAMMQRANAINALREKLEEDLSMVPSEELMNEKRYRTNTNATKELVKRAVRVIKDWNYNHPDQKWCITNKLICEVTKSVDHEAKGVTVKAISKAVEGMDLESYNKAQDLVPVINRTLKGELGNPLTLMSIKDVVGIDE